MSVEKRISVKNKIFHTQEWRIIMRIGIRAHDVAYAPLDELIPNIHKQGFHCMHIALSKSIKEFKPGVESL